MKNLTIKDLVTIGIFTAIYFITLAACTFTSFMLIPGVSFMFLPAIAAFVCGAIYLLLVVKVQKFGAITILGTVIGVFFAVSGHFITALPTCIIFSVLADLIAGTKKYKSVTTNIISYIVYAFSLTGPILPMWLLKAQYVQHLLNDNKTQEYVDARFIFINTQSLILVAVGIIICAIIGGLIGKKLLKKHFEKAGVI